jgi:integrase
LYIHKHNIRLELIEELHRRHSIACFSYPTPILDGDEGDYSPAGVLRHCRPLQEEIKAMTRVQRQLFLATALREAPRYYPLLFVLAGTGMRLGEALALQPEDFDYATKTIRIARAFSEDGTLDTPKSGHGRTLDMSIALADTLMAHERTRKQDKLRYGWADQPPWSFLTKAGTPLDPANIRRAMLRILKKA